MVSRQIQGAIRCAFQAQIEGSNFQRKRTRFEAGAGVLVENDLNRPKMEKKLPAPYVPQTAVKWTNSKHHRFNGKSQTKEQVFEAIKNLHANSTVKLNSLQDLAVTPGVVAQVSKSTVTTGGSAKEQTTVRIVKVEERGGKKIMTSLVMVQAA
ncbi:hypothetical protein B0H17DRAFT_1147051 [Mycena rosella]|uniref:Uncharacterized protein n=1 Tax=Mycena rosella TaxID=1033263 RepID=A0AAD7CMP1_MYCRO|nr:hypothetical protein B0H17DRAFT_1147051 [Mycena rosella]